MQVTTGELGALSVISGAFAVGAELLTSFYLVTSSQSQVRIFLGTSVAAACSVALLGSVLPAPAPAKVKRE